MALILAPATAKDLPSMVTAEYSAFHPHDTLHRLIYPSPDPVPPHVIERTIARQIGSFSEPHVTWLKMTDSSTGAIVAAAKWLMWRSGESSTEKRWPDEVDVNWVLEEEKGLTAGKGSDDKAYVEWVLEGFFKRKRESIQGPCIFLDLLFCAPSHQGRGAGKRLVEWGTTKADELGLTAFVEASSSGLRLYQSCGFVIKEDVVLDGSKIKDQWDEYEVVEYKFMVREKKQVSP